MSKEEKIEEVKPVVKKEPKKVKVTLLRGITMPDGWLPAGEYEFSKQEAKNLIKKGFAKK